MRPEDYWLHSSPSSFNEDLRRKNGWRREKKTDVREKQPETEERRNGPRVLGFLMKNQEVSKRSLGELLDMLLENKLTLVFFYQTSHPEAQQ